MVHTSLMTTAAVTEILFTTTKAGKRRALRWSTHQMRTFPMPLAEAEIMVATGQAIELLYKPFTPEAFAAAEAGLPLTRELV